MHALAFTLVVCGAVVHALWNIIAKAGSGGPLFVWAYSAISALIYLPIAIWAVVATSSAWTPLGMTAVFTSGVLHLGYALALQGGSGTITGKLSSSATALRLCRPCEFL